MDDVTELRQQLADIAHERDGFRTAFLDAAEQCLKAQRDTGLLAKDIGDAASKLGITSEGVALTGPHPLMLLGDMVGMVEAAARLVEPVKRTGHTIPQWLRTHFDGIEMDVRQLGAEGTFTQMRTKMQAYFEMQRAQPATAKMDERSAKDYAIEHTEYLAIAADSVQEAYTTYSLAQINIDEGGDEGEVELTDLVDSARGDLHEALEDLRGMA